MDFKKTNSAVLKSMFMQMQKDVFIKNAQLLKEEYINTKPTFYNQNYITKLWLLYKFCAIWYSNFWCKKI